MREIRLDRGGGHLAGSQLYLMLLHRGGDGSGAFGGPVALRWGVQGRSGGGLLRATRRGGRTQ